MKIYDTYSNTIKEFNDIDVNIYNCGPTVYNHIHIGNARPLIVFDVLHRYLLTTNKHVKYVHNLTDIDDKIIKKAIEENTSEKEVSEKYIDAYSEIRKSLNTLDMITPKVTDNIEGIIEYIHRMINANNAYSIGGNVYFDISSVSDYGCLSHKQIEELEVGERVSVDDNKKNPGDFVLWKKTDVGIQWDTPWAKGRPGWHTECAYLVEKYFGTNLTIHGGGVDLKFPHHENENAQNNAVHHCGLAKIWMHVGHVNINNEKMSKSLNNFVLMKDLLEKYDYQTIRWFFYGTNYSNPLNFSEENLMNADNEVKKMNRAINLAKTQLILNNVYAVDDKNQEQAFLDHLDNDLNIVNAITVLQALIKELNIEIRNKNYNNANTILNKVVNALKVLGIEFDNIHTMENLQLIHQYHDEVNNKNYEKSDALRKILNERGLI